MQQAGDSQASLSTMARPCLIQKEGNVGRIGEVPAGKYCV